jgi:hypothetical protein
MKHSWRVIDAVRGQKKRLPVYTAYEYATSFLFGILMGVGLGVAAVVMYIKMTSRCF